MIRSLVPILAPIALFAAGTAAHAQEVIRLWPNGAPGSIGPMPAQVTTDRPPYGLITRNVSDPTLTVFAPDPKIANGTAVIVAPGGGFHLLSIGNEGDGVARWLNGLGITAFVLRYRLLPTGDDFGGVLIRRLMNFKALEAAVAPLRPLATADGEEAVRYVRAHAAHYGVKPGRIGMMGFSAGGGVTLWTVLGGKPASRPDFVVAMYPGLVGDPLAVPANAPPLLAMVAEDDPLVRPEAGRLVDAWKAAGDDATLVTFEKGGHGFGIKKSGKPSDAWTERAQSWFEAKGLLRK
ncbi:alpha/beta hydrolase [Sphingomonas sp. HITSZ_GF]|uniref:alpha/beta hydrolase n=1 Tax=Sphingomonas sp. HITSZ_GF TaxID=3037247 RepID=UPI00240D5255|nr:alpha/beta hydrolase [Sphingomonas sp. HITSZ_GF]MDG2532136.1 alpha/beta hydrolase [Sphingomonas sp. HITSZ_GF]